MNSSRYPLLLLFALMTFSCKSSFDDSLEYETVAQINLFSVPDSAPSASIPVHIAGLIGKTSASSFKSVYYQRTDSLFEFAVYGRLIDKSNEVYVPRDVTFDTTLVISINPPRTGRHIFIVYGNNGAFADTCRLF